MSDFNSSLPVRTQNNGDVVVNIADGTIETQKLAVDSSGKITAKLDDAAGNGITSQVNGSQRALDVGIDVGGVQIDPRQIRTLTSSDTVTVVQPTATSLNATVVQPTAANLNALAAQGAPNTAANAWPVKVTDGTNIVGVAPASTAALSTQPAQVVALSPNTPLPSGSNAIGTVNASNFPSTVDTNYGTVGSNTIRSAAQVGNATGAADFNNGATSAQTLRVAANLAVSGANVTLTNPVPVTITTASTGTPIQNYQTSAALAAGSSVTLTYTVPATHTFSWERVWVSGSGKIKAVVQNNGSTIFAAFNSTANPNIDITITAPPSIVAGNTASVIITNNDLVAFDVYATIEGNQVS